MEGGRQIQTERSGDNSSLGRQDGMVCESLSLKVKFLHNISVRHSTDKKLCFIVRVVLLSRGHLAVADKLNSCVKIIDLEARKLIGKVSLPSEPQDITAIREDRLAVILDNQRCLQLLRVTPRLARSITLPLPGRKYKGLIFRGDKLYLVCGDPCSIQICNLYGTLLQQINNLNNVGNLFKFPECIAVSPDGAHIYVSDMIEDKIVCLTPEEKTLWTYPTGHSCWRPRGMDVDKQGRLFVCSVFPKIIMLSSAGGLGTLLLDKEVMQCNPWTLAVGDGRMYLGSNNYNDIDECSLEAADSARQEEEDNED